MLSRCSNLVYGKASTRYGLGTVPAVDHPIYGQTEERYTYGYCIHVPESDRCYEKAHNSRAQSVPDVVQGIKGGCGHTVTVLRGSAQNYGLTYGVHVGDPIPYGQPAQ